MLLPASVSPCEPFRLHSRERAVGVWVCAQKKDPSEQRETYFFGHLLS